MTGAPSRRQVLIPTGLGRCGGSRKQNLVARHTNRMKAARTCARRRSAPSTKVIRKDGAYLRRNQGKVSCLTPGEPLGGNAQGKSAEAIVATKSRRAEQEESMSILRARRRKRRRNEG